jgi:hypothetical protein
MVPNAQESQLSPRFTIGWLACLLGGEIETVSSAGGASDPYARPPTVSGPDERREVLQLELPDSLGPFLL